MASQSIWRRPQVWIGIVVSLASLGLIFLIIDVAAVANALATADYHYVLLSSLGIVGFLILRAIRWRFLLDNSVRLTPIFHIQNIGYMLNNILPLRLGDAARGVLIAGVPPVTLARGLSTMLIERLFDFLFVATLFPFTLANSATVPDEIRGAARVSGVLAVGGIIVLIIAANQRRRALALARWGLERLPFLDTGRWAGRIDELLQGLNTLTRLRDGLLVILLSIAVWQPIIYAYYAALQAFGLEPTYLEAGFVVCMAAFAISAPSSPGGAGPFHAAVTLGLVSVLNRPADLSAAFAFLYHFLNLAVVVVFGLIAIPRVGTSFSRVVATARGMLSRNSSPPAA